MKARLIEQYDVTLTKREMDGLMTALRVFVREFDASDEVEQLLAELEDVYTGGGAGLGVTPPPETDDNDEEGGGAAVVQ